MALVFPRRRGAGADICILSVNYPPEPTGIATYTGSLAIGLTREGYRVAALVAHPHYPQWQIHEGYGKWTTHETVSGVAVMRLRHYVPKTPRGVRRLLSELSFGLRIIFAQWDSPKTVVLLSPPLFATAMAALRARLTPGRPRVIVWVQDLYSLGLMETGQGGGLVQAVMNQVERWTLRAADSVVVIHQRFADYVVRRFGVPHDRVVVIRNWTHIPPSDVSVGPIPAREALGWPRDGLLAVHTGNMGVKQGLENIVDAARIADDREAPLNFILVGDGSERVRLEAYARGVQRITFVDPLDSDQYRLALRAADVLIVNELPGVSAMAMPSKLTSYFDAGRAVVAATDPEGITASEIAEAGAGLVIPAGDPDALVDALLYLRDNPAVATAFGDSGRLHREEVLGQRAAIEHWRACIGVDDEGGG